jgi:hypothetical protein
METSSTTFLCTQLSKKGDTLQVSACFGTSSFALVPRDAFDDSYHCGVVGSAYAIGTPQEIETCFFTAYQQCLADSMGYTTLIEGIQVEQDFYIDTHCGIGYKRGIGYRRGSYAASCASLEMRANGLHFVQCGMDGDLFVPNATH